MAHWSSKLTVVVLIGLAACAAGFAVWFRSQQSRRAIELWGAENAALLRNAPRVELRHFDPPLNLVKPSAGAKEEAAAVVEVGAVADFADIRRVPLDDIDLVAEDSACDPAWDYALRFVSESGEATLWFDTRCHRVYLAEADAASGINPPVMRSVHAFFQRQLVRVPAKDR